MYVWFDALNVYRTASYNQATSSQLTANSSVLTPTPASSKLPAPSFSYWPANLHIIGKDILRFHAVYWPAMLLSSKIVLPKELFVHGFITANGQKMSKSLGNVVDPVEFANKVGVDALRYYLLREIPSDDDGDFSEEKFKARYNADLANGLGNFASRVLTLSEKLNPWSLFTDYSLLSTDIKHAIAEVRKSVDLAMNERRFHDALAHVWRLVSFGDKMVNATKPWELKDEDSKKREVLSELLVLLNEISIQIKPFMPEIAQKLSDCIIKDGDKIVSVHKPTAGLFPRI
jgi:methionyl-tRNA synthetase